MRVLVTGATGFVGGAAARALLAAGHEVVSLVRPGRENAAPPGTAIAVGDLRDHDAMLAATAGCEAVVHAAALLGEFGPPTDYWDVNVAGTRYLLDGARRAGVRRFVFISSPSALMAPGGPAQLDIAADTPFPETFLNEYSRTKARAEQIVQQYNSDTLTTVSLRPRAVWGPGDTSGPFPRLVAALRAGRLPNLAPAAPVLASVCHIDRLTHAILGSLSADTTTVAGRAYFVADDQPWDIWQKISDIAARLGIPAPSRQVPRPAVDALTAVTEKAWRWHPLAARVDPPLSRYVRALLTTSATYDISPARTDLHLPPSPPVDRLIDDWVQTVDPTPLPAGRPPLRGTPPPAAVTNLWVVIPALNEEKLIADTINGLAAQENPDFSVVVVDNGSTDGTVAVVERTAALHPHLRLEVITETQKGTGAAADTGMRHAISCGASHLARTDADCIPEPDWTARIVAAFGDGLELISGEMLLRADENISRVDTAILRSTIEVAATFGKFRSGNQSPAYIGPYVMTPGCNMAITAELYCSAGGFPRTRIEDLHEDRALVNAVRTITHRYARRRDVAAQCSNRRINAWGIAKTLGWYADHRYRPTVVDIR